MSLHFPWGLPVDVNDLGLMETVMIGEHKVTMTLPRVPDDGSSQGSLSAPLSYAGTPLPDAVLEAFKGRWGYQSSDRLCPVHTAGGSVLLTPSDEMWDSPEFETLSAGFFTWSRIVQEWAALRTGEPLRDWDNQLRSSAIHLHIQRGHLVGNPARFRTLYVGLGPLTREQLRGALRCASKGEHPPIEHRTLLYAKDALIGGDYRKAVIDAATAAEVALASYVRDQLTRRRLPAVFVEKVIKDVNGIINLHGLCEKLGGMPGVKLSVVKSQIAGVRNMAAHGGSTPSKAEADLAIKHASTIVRALRPLPGGMAPRV
ncbi:hypothetical protein GCM10009837_12470 [Streptomyces durmitorensis]|uniref:DUF4145 domain-containing protein n=1 Tax=Streptomyces durmitorensis TaxID=319947 RepID=A0ABY4PY36_9ACTN|nr:hypothetical protein [Streptomyces durmitorensis]UQT58481.1 hypothetical protein M4V62_27285 [Streptomyces durmitorensis]